MGIKFKFNLFIVGRFYDLKKRCYLKKKRCVEFNYKILIKLLYLFIGIEKKDKYLKLHVCSNSINSSIKSKAMESQ